MTIQLPKCSAGTKQEVTPDKTALALEAIRIWPLARLLSVSPWTIEREIARGRLKSIRTRRHVFGLFARSSCPGTVIPLLALHEYLAARGFNEPLPPELNSFPAPRLAISLARLADDAGVSRRTLHRDIRAGKLRPTRIARRVVIGMDEAKRYLKVKLTGSL
jgi:hypothetical protein